jgi:TPR repeat protein
MKKFLLVLLVANVMVASAQTIAPKVYHKKVRTVSTVSSAFDSATYYYNLGWDNYKLDSMGPARYYWDKASYASGKWASKNAALYRLGIMLQNGEGLDSNVSMALDYYKKASGYGKKLGDPDAIKTIGGMYENGYGVEQSYRKALEWYLKAKQAGNQFADEDITRARQRIQESISIKK